uniref:Gamma-soluble NSF attachment protein n=1 Tax=Astyanax mexicanus TaxID=7994 RepID=A0A8B9JA57_ASTMX
MYFNSLKTSMTKWKPDYDGAASEMAKAAVAFKNAKQFDQAKDAYLKEAEYHTDNKAYPFPQSKIQAIEQAGMMLKDMKRLPEAVELIEKASVMYVENGTSGTAGMALDRAGNYSFFDIFYCVSFILMNHSAVFFFLQKTIAQVLVHLHRGDFVAADKCVRESYSLPGFSGSEDCVAMETLLAGYDEQDEDQVARVCNSPLLKYMDNDYAKLAISLKVPGGGGKKKKTPAAPQGGAGGAPKVEDEDDYEGGLC